MAASTIPNVRMLVQYRPILQQRPRLATLPGAVLLVWLSAVMVLDWWLPDGAGSRAVPHALRLGLVVLLCVYCVGQLRTLSRSRVAWFQLLWLVFMCVSFVSTDYLDSASALYVGYYALWIVVFWGAYCLSANCHLTPRQVALAGTVLNAVTCVYDILFIYLGRRPGQPYAPVSTNPFSLGEAYVLLWFLLMQVLAPIRASGAVVALTSIVVVIFGLERGAFISMLLGLLVYTSVQAYIRPRSKKRGIKWLVPTLLAVGLACYLTVGGMIARWAVLSNPAIAGSGRLRFWTVIFNDWSNADAATKLFGSGPRTVQMLLGPSVVFAHNDFLEQLHCFGLLGAVLFIGVCAAMLRECYLLVKLRSTHADVFCAATAVFISTGLYCIASYATSTVWFSVAAGVALGTGRRQRYVCGPGRFRLFAVRELHENPLLRQLGSRPSR